MRKAVRTLAATLIAVGTMAAATPAQAGKAAYLANCGTNYIYFTGVPGGTNYIDAYVDYVYVGRAYKPFQVAYTGDTLPHRIDGWAYSGTGRYKGVASNYCAP